MYSMKRRLKEISAALIILFVLQLAMLLAGLFEMQNAAVCAVSAIGMIVVIVAYRMLNVVKYDWDAR